MQRKKSYKKYVENPKEKYMWKISSVKKSEEKKRGEEKSPRKARVMQMWCWKNIESYFIFFLDSWNLLVCFFAPFDECRTSHRTEWNRTRTNFMRQNHVRNARKSCEHCVSVVAWIVREKEREALAHDTHYSFFFRFQVQSRNPTKKTFSFVRHRRRRNKKFITMMGKYQGEMCLNLNTIWESTLLWVKQNQQQQHQWREEAQTSKRFKWSEKKGRESSSLFSSFLLCVVFFLPRLLFRLCLSLPLALFRYRCRRQSVCVSPRASRICAALCMMMLLKKT